VKPVLPLVDRDGELSAALGYGNAYIEEAHHATKRDAPSARPGAAPLCWLGSLGREVLTGGGAPEMGRHIMGVHGGLDSGGGRRVVTHTTRSRGRPSGRSARSPPPGWLGRTPERKERLPARTLSGDGAVSDPGSGKEGQATDVRLDGSAGVGTALVTPFTTRRQADEAEHARTRRAAKSQAACPWKRLVPAGRPAKP